MKTLKTTPELIKDIEHEIKVTEKCMKESAKKGDYREALEYQQSIGTLEFVISLAKGELD
jgi:hypothetical protein